MDKQKLKREKTRAKIIEAALEAFSAHGFNKANTREIANQAGVNQGLITYHFKSKEFLWKEVANAIFAEARQNMVEELLRNADSDPRTRKRNMIKSYVRFAAKKPELFRLMVEEGKNPSERLQWLVNTHLTPVYQVFKGLFSDDENLDPHYFYSMLGAGSLLFALGPVCKSLTGLDPDNKRAIETHANFVAGLLVP